MLAARGVSVFRGALRFGAAALAVVVALGVLATAASASATFRLPYGGGPVLHSSSPYLVFWTPPGESIPASSEGLMERFFSDVAADSGTSSNVYGVLRQYHDQRGFADYRQRFDPARQVIIDTQPYPPPDPTYCPDVSVSFPTCIGELQVESEVQRLITSLHLPTAGGVPGPELRAYAPIYFVVLPTNVAFCNGSNPFVVSGCSDKNTPGYHWSFKLSSGRDVLFAAIATYWSSAVGPPGVTWPCGLGGGLPPQEPNHDPADCVLSTLNHEDAEAITDPLSSDLAWSTSNYMEAADECGNSGPFDPAKGINPNSYAPILGGSASAGTQYDQLINGHPYELQSVWSNGLHTCAQRPSPGRIRPRFTVSRVHLAATSRSFDPAASTSTHPLSSATWDFGDGSQTKFLFGTVTLSSVKHSYKRPGRYTVSLTLVDNTGNLKTVIKHVTIP